MMTFKEQLGLGIFSSCIIVSFVGSIFLSMYVWFLAIRWAANLFA